MLDIRGGGAGHGIGMSQYGAYGYALHGLAYPAILAHYYTGTRSVRSTRPGLVRVLLATGAASFTRRDERDRHEQHGWQDRHDHAARDEHLHRRPSHRGLLQIVDAGGSPVGPAVAAPLTVTGPAPLQIPRLGAYRGSLQFRPDGRGGVETVDAVGLDDYVRGVVAEEMPSSWAAQALEAQAVAARTYAITTTAGATGYDLYSDTRSQMYGGVHAETAATDSAVAATADRW